MKFNLSKTKTKPVAFTNNFNSNNVEVFYNNDKSKSSVSNYNNKYIPPRSSNTSRLESLSKKSSNIICNDAISKMNYNSSNTNNININNKNSTRYKNNSVYGKPINQTAIKSINSNHKPSISNFNMTTTRVTNNPYLNSLQIDDLVTNNYNDNKLISNNDREDIKNYNYNSNYYSIPTNMSIKNKGVLSFNNNNSTTQNNFRKNIKIKYNQIYSNSNSNILSSIVKLNNPNKNVNSSRYILNDSKSNFINSSKINSANVAPNYNNNKSINDVSVSPYKINCLKNSGNLSLFSDNFKNKKVITPLINKEINNNVKTLINNKGNFNTLSNNPHKRSISAMEELKLFNNNLAKNNNLNNMQRPLSKQNTSLNNFKNKDDDSEEMKNQHNLLIKNHISPGFITNNKDLLKNSKVYNVSDYVDPIKSKSNYKSTSKGKIYPEQGTIKTSKITNDADLTNNSNNDILIKKKQNCYNNSYNQSSLNNIINSIGKPCIIKHNKNNKSQVGIISNLKKPNLRADDLDNNDKTSTEKNFKLGQTKSNISNINFYKNSYSSNMNNQKDSVLSNTNSNFIKNINNNYAKVSNSKSFIDKNNTENYSNKETIRDEYTNNSNNFNNNDSNNFSNLNFNINSGNNPIIVNNVKISLIKQNINNNYINLSNNAENEHAKVNNNNNKVNLYDLKNPVEDNNNNNNNNSKEIINLNKNSYKYNKPKRKESLNNKINTKNESLINKENVLFNKNSANNKDILDINIDNKEKIVTNTTKALNNNFKNLDSKAIMNISKNIEDRTKQQTNVLLNNKIKKNSSKDLKNKGSIDNNHDYYSSNLENILNKSTDSLLSTTTTAKFYQKESSKIMLYINKYYNKYGVYPKTILNNFYKVGRFLGKGAFGKVNLALHTLTGRLVAMKSFNKKKIDLEKLKKKIIYETDILKSLHHKNIVKIYETFETEKFFMITMEFISCGDLITYVKKRSKLTEIVSKFIFKQIILGLKYIHSRGVVHRDIKLDNILIDINSNIKICDFGVSKKFASSQDIAKNKRYELLTDQCGTPAYIAPEIFKGNGYEAPPVDIWSAGVVLYAMLSGTVPFKAGKISDLKKIVIKGSYNKIKNISEEAEDLLSMILQVDPTKRITADEILNHPWMVYYDCNNLITEDQYLKLNNMQLFTDTEKIHLSNSNIDFRYAPANEIVEDFTYKNLNTIIKCDNNKSKSIILAPFNSSQDEDMQKSYNYNSNNKLTVDLLYSLKLKEREYPIDIIPKTLKSNGNSLNFNTNSSVIDSKNFNINTYYNLDILNNIIKFDQKVKALNKIYELNNNGEIDNGIIISPKCFSNQNSNENSLDNINDNKKKYNSNIPSKYGSKINSGLMSPMLEYDSNSNKNLLKNKSSTLDNSYNVLCKLIILCINIILYR